MGATRRGFLIGAGGLAAGAALGAGATRVVAPGPSLAGVTLDAALGRNDVPYSNAGVMNDASLLSPTPVHRHAILWAEGPPSPVEALRAEIAAARDEGRPVALGAARHSMGAHALPREGRAVTFETGAIEVDRAAGTARVEAGARWRDVIAALDPLGLSPKVMQSNHDFGVAATFSVNAHGWPTAHPPMGSTVRSLEMMLADGSLVTASREENADLFRAAMGGYGLLGAITALTLDVVPNLALAPRFQTFNAYAFAEVFAPEARRVPMAYGRMNVDRATFFDEALLVSYEPVDEEPPPLAGSGWVSRRSRDVFRAQTGNEWVKGRRWWIETALGPRLQGTASRNSLLNEPVATLDDRDPARTDILHEYFVPPENWERFVGRARDAILASYQELLNVTLRWLEPDTESVLSYAPGPRVAAVLLFSQEMSLRAEADMRRMTETLIEHILDLGGSYYLPYRPHATREQFRRAYPRWEELVAVKREVDPGGLFRNGFWDNYLSEA